MLPLLTIRLLTETEGSAASPRTLSANVCLLDYLSRLSADFELLLWTGTVDDKTEAICDLS
jgi:hypothetical protein